MALGGSEETYLDPTGEREVVHRTPTTRKGEVAGRVGLLDISKARGDVFLDRMEERLRARGLEVNRFRKPTFTKPAPADLRREIAEKCDFVIEALAD
jgi:hypothetical protein